LRSVRRALAARGTRVGRPRVIASIEDPAATERILERVNCENLKHFYVFPELYAAACG
jgi:hypothetical protein